MNESAVATLFGANRTHSPDIRSLLPPITTHPPPLTTGKPQPSTHTRSTPPPDHSTPIPPEICRGYLAQPTTGGHSTRPSQLLQTCSPPPTVPSTPELNDASSHPPRPTPSSHPPFYVPTPPPSTPHLPDSSTPPLLHASTRLTRTGREKWIQIAGFPAKLHGRFHRLPSGSQPTCQEQHKDHELVSCQSKHLSNRSGSVTTFVAMCLSFSIQSDLGETPWW
jgi:hypothetical protein